MSKKILLIINFFILFILTGCINKVKIPVGVTPTKEFTVSNYINDDGIYQASSVLTITGTSEDGVVIVATLTDKKGNIINESYCTTSNDGIWTLSFDTPDASDDNYSLKIKDSKEIYHQTYNDIKFGEVWLYIGDELNNIDFLKEKSTKDEENEELIDYNKMFYKDEKWIPASFSISEFGYLLTNKIYNSNKSWNKCPVAIVFATVKESMIYEWLSDDSISSRLILKQYLEKENIDYINDISLYELFLSQYKNMSFANIIFNQGIKDINYFNKNNYSSNEFRNIYSLQLYTLIGDLIHDFNLSNNVYILQDSLHNCDNISLLRSIQSNITNYYDMTSIVPTYDLNLFFDENKDEIVNEFTDETIYEELTLLGYDYEKLINRIYNFDRNEIEATKLDHVVQEYDDKKNIISIKLIFENDIYTRNSDEIIGIIFKDENGEIVELKYEIIDNELIINLLDVTNKDENEDIETFKDIEDVEEQKYIKLSYISYANNNVIYNSNLFSSNNPVIPFEVYLK